MSWIGRRLAALILTCVLLLAACGGEKHANPVAPPSTPAASSAAPTTAPVSADPAVAVYRARTELGLVTADRVIAHVDGQFSDDGFARDESLIYAIDETGDLEAIDPHSGDLLPEYIGCHCGQAFPTTATTVIWWNETDKSLYEADLHHLRAATKTPMTLPDPRDPPGAGNRLSDPTLVAADAHHLIMTRQETGGGYWSYNHLYVVDRDTGAIHQLGRYEHLNEPFNRGVITPDGRSAVLAGEAHVSNGCSHLELIRFTLDADHPTPLAFPITSECLTLDTIHLTDCELTISVTDRKWEQQPRESTHSLWQFDSRQWQQNPDPDLLAHATLSPTTTFEIRTGPPSPKDTSAQLTVVTATKTTVLATHAYDIQTAHEPTCAQ
ncbi:hypothetical protein ACFXHA_13125 [Nocardia sp. NPDC059240]|uniref:hypothetical protein n=1 Tax=Nocardia sp. NPDC059240 TaxID=3346786 RepID=UPI0036976E8A